MTTHKPLLEVEGLSKVFGGRRWWFDRREAQGFAAVSEVGFTLLPGETIGIVGESGSGKSTTARMLLRLVEPSAGRLIFDGEDLRTLDAEALRKRRRGMQMVFQDPYSSLNPRLRIGDQVGEPLLVHGLAKGAQLVERVSELLVTVGLDPRRMRDFPHEFSGGQRQRIAVARALAAAPRLLVADEAVSALDVSVRAQILNLFEDLKQSSGLALVFISHDLAVVRHLVERTAVMYRGRIIEIGPTAELFPAPRHPYTRALLSAVPGIQSRSRRPVAAPAVDLLADSAGCPYVSRCYLAVGQCHAERPPLVMQSPGHLSACFRAREVKPPQEEPAVLSSAAAERLRRLQARFMTPRGEVTGAVS